MKCYFFCSRQWRVLRLGVYDMWVVGVGVVSILGGSESCEGNIQIVEGRFANFCFVCGCKWSNLPKKYFVFF